MSILGGEGEKNNCSQNPPQTPHPHLNIAMRVPINLTQQEEKGSGRQTAVRKSKKLPGEQGKELCISIWGK